MSEIIGPVHLVGIGGMHMSAIALLLRERGLAVTGSDLRPSALTAKVEAAGVRVFEGHSAANVGSPALVVTTAAAAAKWAAEALLWEYPLRRDDPRWKHRDVTLQAAAEASGIPPPPTVFSAPEDWLEWCGASPTIAQRPTPESKIEPRTP